MASEQTHALVQFGAVRHDRATFARRNSLGRLKTKDTHWRNRPGDTSLILGPDRLRSILNYMNPDFVGQLHDRIHVANVAVGMNWHDGFGFCGHTFLDFRGADTPAVRFDLAK